MGQVILMQCKADACNQGRKPCPCPDACEVADDDLNPWLRKFSEPGVFWCCYIGALVLALIAGTVAVLL